MKPLVTVTIIAIAVVTAVYWDEPRTKAVYADDIDADRQTALPLAGADPMDDGLDDESETTVVDGTQEEEAA